MKSLIDKYHLKKPQNIEKILFFFIFSSIFLSLIIYTLKKSTFFTSIPIDGAFQHINPLRRIAAGELPGRDFQVFHGLAISYLHYPIYALFGKTLFASEVSRYLINGLCAFVAVLAIFGGLRRPSIALGLSAFFIIATKQLGIFWLTDPFGDAYSSLAVRTLVPALALGYLFYINRKQKLSSTQTFSQIVAPLIFFCSIAMTIATEQGMALFLATASALILIHPGQPKWYIRIRDALLFCLFTPPMYMIIIYAITFGHPDQAINFYLKDLPADQFWYFGAYPNIFPKEFTSLLFVPGTHRPLPNYILISIAIILVLFAYFKSKNKVEKNEYRIWMLGLAYGIATLISNLGMISSHYSEAATRIACAIIIVISWTQIERHLSSKNASRFRIFSLCSMALFVIFSPYSLKGIIPSALSFAQNYSNSTLKKRYSGVIPAGTEYNNLFSIASTVIPPKPLLGAQTEQSNQPLPKEKNYLIFHNPPSVLVELISEGMPIEVNGKQEKVEQVSTTHLLSSYSGSEKSFHYRYENPKLTARMESTTPFYSKKTNIWANGVANLPLENGGCMMLGDTRQLANVSDHRVIQFPSESFERRITSHYNNIACVDGPPLEPYVHGYPQQFTIKSALDFSSDEFTLEKDTAIRRLPKITAEWLYHADMGSAYQGIHKKDEEISGIKVKGTKLFPPKHKLDPKIGSGIYFETWSPLPCSYDNRPTIWSTYTGFLELESNTVNQGNVDYIIHALGKKRRADYLNTFENVKPTFVHTLRPSYTAYERWIQTSTWKFYEDILANYELVRKTDYSLIWRRKSDLSKTSNWIDHPDMLCQSKFDEWVAPQTSWDGELIPAEGSQSIILRPLVVNQFDQEQVYVLEVTYSIENRLAKVPVFGKVARFFISPVNTTTPLPVSLPPYENKVIFPIVVSPGKTPKLQFETISLLGQAGFTVESIKYRKILKNVDAYKAAILDY
ncbi:hypothetical protein [Pseudomonas protegens]|uniref:hypothetical protein n=1 Tax=Pseudomonas protegens TaxID=380021 RepID=UPI003850D4FF